MVKLALAHLGVVCNQAFLELILKVLWNEKILNLLSC